MKLLKIAMLLAALAGCNTPPKVVNHEMLLMCREDSQDLQNSQLRLQHADDWHYAGPLYNNGVNCTVTLWQCFDANAPCAK
jgi:hypothetical protein